MSRRTVGIVDYGLGNQASIAHSLRDVGFRVRISAEMGVLDETDVLLLPGVGAYPSAMKALHERGLVDYLKKKAREEHPIIGICLGMQLLATASYEHHYTPGLGLVPGEVVRLKESKWHIGWNTIECVEYDPLLAPSDGQAFYFNHSFSYSGPQEYHVALSRCPTPLPSVIRRRSVIGVQFHPEKSQAVGRVMLRNLITGLCRA